MHLHRQGRGHVRQDRADAVQGPVCRRQADLGRRGQPGRLLGVFKAGRHDAGPVHTGRRAHITRQEGALGDGRPGPRPRHRVLPVRSAGDEHRRGCDQEEGAPAKGLEKAQDCDVRRVAVPVPPPGQGAVRVPQGLRHAHQLRRGPRGGADRRRNVPGSPARGSRHVHGQHPQDPVRAAGRNGPRPQGACRSDQKGRLPRPDKQPPHTPHGRKGHRVRGGAQVRRALRQAGRCQRQGARGGAQ